MERSFSSSSALWRPAGRTLLRRSKSSDSSAVIRRRWPLCRHPSRFLRALHSETYFAVTAFAFSNAGGQTRFGRYRIVPELGNDYLTDAQVSSVSRNYHYEELAERVSRSPIRFRVMVQLAGSGDIVDDSTVHWPENRKMVGFGTVELTSVMPDTLAQQKHIIFDPIPRVDGIDASPDPLLELRAAIYLLGGRRRLAASGAEEAEP